jgi:hypothetical protein
MGRPKGYWRLDKPIAKMKKMVVALRFEVDGIHGAPYRKTATMTEDGAKTWQSDG